MNEKEYYSRMEKINAKLSTDRCSVDEEHNLAVQKNYLSTKYIKFLENKNQILQNQIDKALDFIDCHFKEMVADEEAQELKSILKESGE